jgi:hypothetical protein
MATFRDLVCFCAGLQTIVFASGCAVQGDDDMSTTEQASSVGTVVGSSCTTGSVLGLAKQVAEEVECEGTNLGAFSAGHGIRFATHTVLPYLDAGARHDLRAAAQTGTVWVASGYRTLPQQFLLYRWYRDHHRCGIVIAARPGTSNHESARAVDLTNWAARLHAMEHHGWAHDVLGDDPHFDHLSSPDIRGRDVRAFQRLWNRNHPHDTIAVDGRFGTATARRLKRSPAQGFKKGASCGGTKRMVDVRAIEGPDRVAPGEAASYAVAIANTSDDPWPDGARLVVEGAFVDVPPLQPGDSTTIQLSLVAPASAIEGAPLLGGLSLVADGQEVDSAELAATVSASAGTSMDDVDTDDLGDSIEADEDGAADP